MAEDYGLKGITEPEDIRIRVRFTEELDGEVAQQAVVDHGDAVPVPYKEQKMVHEERFTAEKSKAGEGELL